MKGKSMITCTYTPKKIDQQYLFSVEFGYLAGESEAVKYVWFIGQN